MAYIGTFTTAYTHPADWVRGRTLDELWGLFYTHKFDTDTINVELMIEDLSEELKQRELTEAEKLLFEICIQTKQKGLNDITFWAS